MTMREGTRVSDTRTHNSLYKGFTSRDINRAVDGGQRLAGTTIAGAGGEITDSGDGLGIFEANSIVEVRGSASIDGEYLVTGVAAGALTVDPPCATEAAGAAIEIVRK
jgi:hypothetical protein